MLKTALLVATLAATALAQEASHHLVQVRIRDAHSFQKLQALDLDLAACTALTAPQRLVDVIATDDEIRDKLQGSGLEFEIAIRDLERHYARELAKGRAPALPSTLTPGVGQGGMGGHYTLAEVEAILDSFAATYPALCSAKVSIGKSVQNRDLWMVKISDSVYQQEAEHEIYFDALHHAREPLSLATTLLFMDWLLSKYGVDPEATWLVNNRQIYFVPVVNPDGYEYNRSTNPGGGGMWRKNRRLNSGGSYGVDLNRNYPTGWSAPNGGNSTSQTSDTYRGSAPGSEPEIAALEAFHNAHAFALTFSTHTYTDVLLRPFGYQVANPTNVADYDRIGTAAVTQNLIAQGQTATLLYIAAGCAIDHHHVVRGSYSWTAELGKSAEGGFWPNPTNTVAIANRHQHMFRTVAKLGGAVLDVPTVLVREAAGGNANGRVDPGEAGEVVVTIANTGGSTALVDTTVTLVSLTPGVNVTQGTRNLGKAARFSTTTQSALPLLFAVPANFSGPVVRLQLKTTGDGIDDTRELRIVYGTQRVAVADDFERDRGFERASGGTATGGLFERASPQATFSGTTPVQPGTQHTPGGSFCLVTDGRAGASADDHDVDGGITEAISPRLDLAHLDVARVQLWRWYTELATTGADAMEIAVSNDDGAGWTTLLATPASTAGWVAFAAEIPLPLTDRMRLRIRAQDATPSLVEALVDDLEIVALARDASLTLLSSGARGTSARFGVLGTSGAQALLLASGGTGTQSIPGIGGVLLLDPATLVALPGIAIGATGSAGLDLTIPQDPALVGASTYWQVLHANGTQLDFGNRQRLTFR